MDKYTWRCGTCPGGYRTPGRFRGAAQFPCWPETGRNRRVVHAIGGWCAVPDSKSQKKMINQNKWLIIIIGIFFFSGILVGCSTSKMDQNLIINEAVEQRIKEIIVSGELPSVQAAIIDQNQIVFIGNKSFLGFYAVLKN